MIFSPVTVSVTTTDAGGNGIGRRLVGLRTVANSTTLGGSAFAFSWSTSDAPRQYAAIARRSVPLWFAITGVTRDNSGVALGSCVVKLYTTPGDSMVATQTSDGSGNFTFWVNDSTSNYYLRSYKTGAPDVAGTSVNTIVGA